MGYIYLITNLINNKKYVGQTKFTVEKRWAQHQYDALNERDDFYFHRALRKYGINNFKISILKECPNEELNEYECYYIDEYKTYYIYNQGYNLTRGGNGFTKINDKMIMLEWAEGKSAIEIARNEGVYIKTITDALKRNNITQEEINSRSHQYGARFRKKRIYQYDYIGTLINIYEDIEQLYSITHYSKDYIQAACCHRYSTAHGYIWKYEDDDIDINDLIKQAINTTGVFPVNQYSLSGEYLTTYKSYSNAANVVGCDKSLIAIAAKNNNKTAMGFLWQDMLNTNDIMIKVNIIKNRYNDRKKKIAQLDKTTLEIIHIYDSITDAAKALKKESSRAAISRVCRGEQETSCGYKWKYIYE